MAKIQGAYLFSADCHCMYFLTLTDNEGTAQPFNYQNINGNFLKFIWNRGDLDLNIQFNNLHHILKPNHIICSTYLQNIRFIEQSEHAVILLFNREFYCVHTNDSEVSCNGLLFFGSNTTPILALDEHEVNTLSYLINVLKEEFEVIDGNREEMLRILLKRFIIRCTRLAKQQIFGSAGLAGCWALSFRSSVSLKASCTMQTPGQSSMSRPNLRFR